MTIEGRIGPLPAADGVSQEFRLARTGEQVVSDFLPHFGEAAVRGAVFSAAPTTGLTPGTALTTAAGLALWNPYNSGVNLLLLEVTYAWASGTLGAGKLWHVLHNPTTATPGGTQVIPINTRGGSSMAVGRAYSTATGLGTANAVRISATVTALTADAGTGAVARELVDGLIAVPPGSAYSLQEVGAAGTSPLIFFSYTWMEVPV